MGLRPRSRRVWRSLQPWQRAYWSVDEIGRACKAAARRTCLGLHRKLDRVLPCPSEVLRRENTRAVCTNSYVRGWLGHIKQLRRYRGPLPDLTQQSSPEQYASFAAAEVSAP